MTATVKFILYFIGSFQAVFIGFMIYKYIQVLREKSEDDIQEQKESLAVGK